MTDADVASVETFVIAEAELLDAGDLGAWLDLYADDALYWVPATPGGGDPNREVSVVYDDRVRLAARVDRLLSGKEYAQDPPSRTCRQLSNLATGALAGGEIRVNGVMVVYETRPNTGLQVVPGRVSWRLRPRGESFAIAEKRIDLLDLDRYHENLTFIL